MRRFIAFALACAATGAGAETRALTYQCERGVTIPVVYVNGEADDLAVVVLYVEGRMINLERTRSASGARYQFPNDGSGYVWWSHQDNATLSWHDATTDTDQTLLAACVPS